MPRHKIDAFEDVRSRAERDTRLSEGDRQLLSFYLRNSDYRSRECWCKPLTIMERLRRERGWLKRHRRRLVGFGYLAHVGRRLLRDGRLIASIWRVCFAPVTTRNEAPPDPHKTRTLTLTRSSRENREPEGRPDAQRDSEVFHVEHLGSWGGGSDREEDRRRRAGRKASGLEALREDAEDAIEALGRAAGDRADEMVAWARSTVEALRYRRGGWRRATATVRAMTARMVLSDAPQPQAGDTPSCDRPDWIVKLERLRSLKGGAF